MKRFKNKKLHEFVCKKYGYDADLADTYFAADGDSGFFSSSEDDIAGYLQDKLKIAVDWIPVTDDTQTWRARAGRFLLAPMLYSPFRTQAIFQCAENILNQKEAN